LISEMVMGDGIGYGWRLDASGFFLTVELNVEGAIISSITSYPGAAGGFRHVAQAWNVGVRLAEGC
jgi:hypothetical protein